MDNITSILHIWLSGIRNSGNRECATVEDRQIDLSQERGPGRIPKRNLGATRDCVVEDAAVRVPRVVTEGRDPDRDRADRDHDRANQDRDHDHDRGDQDRGRADRDHVHTNRDQDRDRGRGLRIAPDRAAAGDRQANPPRGGEQGQDRTLSRSARTTNRPADRNQAPKRVVPDPDENRDPEVAPGPAAGIITGAGAARDRLPLSKSHERDHDPRHPDGYRAAVPGLCQSHQVVEVALGRELSPQIMLTSKTRTRDPKIPFKRRQWRRRIQKRIENKI